MILKPQDYQAIAREMIEADRDKIYVNREVDDIYENKWELPQELKDLGWVRAVKMTSGHDAVEAGIRVLATNSPNLKIVPLLDNEPTRANFNRIEKALMWHYQQASRRGIAWTTRDIVASALKYDDIVAQVVYLPYQQKSLAAIGGKRLKRFKGYGPFSIVVHHPSTVHTRYSDWGLEAVLLEKRMKVHEVLSFWGDMAKELKERYKSEADWVQETVTLYDYMDDTVRYVWVDTGAPREGTRVENAGSSNYAASTVTIMKPTEHGLPFLPWVSRISGSGPQDYAAVQRKPLLLSIIQTEAWKTQNLFNSLMFSLAMARATEPVTKTITMSGEGVETDSTQPAGQYNLKPGENLDRMPPAGIDPTIREMVDRLGQLQARTTATTVLQTQDVPSGMAFATYNAMLQVATGVLTGSKRQSELAIADIFRHMVGWTKFMGDPLMYYNDKSKDARYGQQDMVTPDMLPNMEDLYMEVGLREYVPTDQMQKINAANMLVQSMPYPTARALELLDVPDPEKAFEEWAREQKDKATVQIEIGDMQFEQQMAQQRAMMQMQQQQAMEAQQAQMMQGQGMPPSAETMMSQSPFAAMQGQGFDTNRGGTPPATGAPDFTRESITGVPRPTVEGRDNRGLRMQPQGREAIE